MSTFSNSGPPESYTRGGRARCCAAVAVAVLALALPQVLEAGLACERTARAMRFSCRNEVQEDYWNAVAVCYNESDPEERSECLAEARVEFSEGQEECREQNLARLELCEDLDESRYDPDFDPADFATEFTDLNGYLPLSPGNLWVYEGGDETITVEVLDETKLIEGVTCVVVNDLVEEDGVPIEDTDDWMAQALNGDVHYCGEIALNFETFEGDDPELPELVDIEGSFKAGRDGAKSGILMFDFPEVGEIYRQEWALGDAEDVAEVLANDYSYGDDPELDEFVPQALAEALCDADCVVTLEFSPLEPDAEERKYYAPGIGLFLEVDLEEGETVELVDCNLAACALLP